MKKQWYYVPIRKCSSFRTWLYFRAGGPNYALNYHRVFGWYRY